MQYQHTKTWIFVLGLTFLISISCISCSLRREEIVLEEEGYYLINPDTILAEIAQGKTDVFTQQNIPPETQISNSFNTVQWNQEDYLDIIRALYSFVWNESIEDWNIRHILFSMNCEDINSGPQFAYFILYRVDNVRETESRFERQIYIDPSNGSVKWSEVEYYPNLVHQRPIELAQYKVSISNALQIAERNGGEKARTGVDNNCIVRTQLFNSNNQWRVSYLQVLDLFVVDVDALTGEYAIIVKETK